MITHKKKNEKTTEIYFDETPAPVVIRTHNTALKKRLLAFAEKFPNLCRLTDDDELEVAEIEKVMKRAGGKILRGIKLFDVYRDKQIEVGKKSVAFSVSLRADDRTLTDEEADKAVNKILSALEKEKNITLRK